jgi:hypothetical protein
MILKRDVPSLRLKVIDDSSVIKIKEIRRQGRFLDRNNNLGCLIALLANDLDEVFYEALGLIMVDKKLYTY